MEFKYTIGCETTGLSAVDPSHVLQAFKDLDDREVTLLLVCMRNERSDFSAWNYIEKNGLEDRVTLLQYYDRNEYSGLRQSCRIWIRKNTRLIKMKEAFPTGNSGSGPKVAGECSRHSESGENFPLISVVLPFFNAEENLEDAVSSVTEQDYRNLELILVDDASNDDSRRIAETLAEKDSRIRILEHYENMGAGPARNTGALNACGDYLFFLDSDDILRRRALELLCRTAAEEDVGLVIGSCNQVDEHGNYGDYDRDRDSGRENYFGSIDGTEALRRSLNVEEGSFLPVRPWGMLIDLKLYRDSGLTFPSGEYEDLSVVPFLYKYAGKVVYLKDIVVTYRIRQGSVTQSPLSLERVSRYCGLWDLISRRIEEFGVEDYRRDFKIFHVGHLLWLLNHGISDKDVLDAAADLIHGKMKFDKGVFSGDQNLKYMLDYISSILMAAGEERDFTLWGKFVSGLGDDAVVSFFRHKMHEIGLSTRFK